MAACAQLHSTCERQAGTELHSIRRSSRLAGRGELPFRGSETWGVSGIMGRLYMVMYGSLEDRVEYRKVIEFMLLVLRSGEW